MEQTHDIDYQPKATDVDFSKNIDAAIKKVEELNSALRVTEQLLNKLFYPVGCDFNTRVDSLAVKFNAAAES